MKEIRCPKCRATTIVRNGHKKDGTQKYLCKSCNRTFSLPASGSINGSRKDLAVWAQFITCMNEGLSIRKAAELCGIHRNTAWAWKQKLEKSKPH